MLSHRERRNRSPYESAHRRSVALLVISLLLLPGSILFATLKWAWPLLAWWGLSLGALLMLIFNYPRCPTCDTPLWVSYRSRFLAISSLWPAKRCAGCGADLTR